MSFAFAISYMQPNISRIAFRSNWDELFLATSSYKFNLADDSFQLDKIVFANTWNS